MALQTGFAVLSEFGPNAQQFIYRSFFKQSSMPLLQALSYNLISSNQVSCGLAGND